MNALVLFILPFSITEQAAAALWFILDDMLCQSLLNEFMCGPLDIQGIKGKTGAEAEHDTGSLPDWLINPDEYEPVVLNTEHRAPQPTDSINDPRKLTPVYTYGSFN